MEDLSNAIRLCKITIKSTQNKLYKALLSMKLRFLIFDFDTKYAQEGDVELKDKVNFIGLSSYDIRVS